MHLFISFTQTLSFVFLILFSVVALFKHMLWLYTMIMDYGRIAQWNYVKVIKLTFLNLG